jgi:hypothetical protein
MIKMPGITMGRLILLVFIIFFIFLLSYTMPMAKVDLLKCAQALKNNNITRCDKLNYVPTINPFKHSTECYCQNEDWVYFKME